MKRTKNTKVGKQRHGSKSETFNRTEVLADLRDMLKDMSDKVCRGRIKDKAAFDLKLRAIKAFSYSVSVFSSVLDAQENEVILERLGVLEARDRGSVKHD